MEDGKDLQIELSSYDEDALKIDYDLDKIIYDLDSQIDLLSSQADKFDYLVSIGSGILCGMLDVLWVGSFSLERGRSIASDEIDRFVTKTAKMLGHKKGDLKSAVKFLEMKFPIPSDGNTPDFGGGLQHHLRDFAHHPTIVGLVFSLLTQFTCKSYGTDVKGVFKIADVPEVSKVLIGKDVPTKIIYGTITWFFHLVSDVAGSSSTAGLSGGTGIPGPILALAKELSALPIFWKMAVGDNSLSVFLSKLFNGTLLAKHDESSRIIKDSALKFDFRSELGLGIEIGRQAIPVVANECIVRGFYLIRRLGWEIKENNIRSLSKMKQIDWDKIKPLDNPTIARMLTISTGVFTAVEVGEAAITQKFCVSINYIGVGRFAVAIGEDVSWWLKARNIKRIKQMYEDIKRFTYTQADESTYKRMGSDMDVDKLGLTMEQTEILYNIEYYKVVNDVQATKMPVGGESIKRLKQDWLEEWKVHMTKGFSSFLQIEGAELRWYKEQELLQKIEENEPQNTWFRLVLLEAMLFEPYYPLGVEKDKKGNDVPSKKYSRLQVPLCGYSRVVGDGYLDSLFIDNYYTKGYIRRLRRCYNKVIFEMKEVLKGILIGGAITAGVTVVTIATIGALAPVIAVALVGSNFAGLSGAALTSACLAYLGGGAIAAGGLGMAGGTAAIVGGGAILSIGVGAGVGSTAVAVGLLGKRNTILQSAKLLVSIREIFLNDEHDTMYSDSVYEQYVQNIMDIEKGLVELRLQADVADGKERKELIREIKNAEESVEAMKLARKIWLKFMISFEEGFAQTGEDEYSEVPYCTKCDAILSEQLGFDENDGTWICLECGQLLYGDELEKTGEVFKGVIWYCDNCNAILNKQSGFDDSLGVWDCTECGYNGEISENEIFGVDVDAQAIKKIKNYVSMNITFDNNVTIAISDFWEPVDTLPENPLGTQAFCKVTDYSECLITAYPIDIQHIMLLDNPQAVISGIREALGTDQALIEVKSVRAKTSGFIYSVVKTLMQPHGVQYTLTLDLVAENGAVHIQGFFNEAGVTGQRDAIVYEIERRNGNVGENFEGWLKDPYDDSIERDYAMNLSEYEKYDKMFPQHPLSVARAFIKGLRIL